MEFLIKRFNVIIVSICIAMLSSCSTMQRTELYFGRAIPGGGHVDDEQWSLFCNNVVTKYFPQGYTEYDATGKWYDPDAKQTIAEKTKVILFVGKKSALRNAQIDSVAQRYIKTFHQQSVLRIDAGAKVQFLGSK